MCMYMCIHIHTHTHINILYIYLFSFQRIPEVKWNVFTFAYLQRQFCWYSLNLLNSHFFLNWAIDDSQSCVIFRCIAKWLGYVYTLYICIYIYIFNSNADGEWRAHEEPTTESPETLYAFCWFCRDSLASVPNAPRPHCPGLTLQAPSLSLWGPKLEGRAHCPLPGAWSFLSASSPSSHPGSWLTPAPGNPSGSSKPPWVCTGQNWEFKPHVTAHRSISVRLIGFWKKTGSYLTVLVVVLPECLRKARNSDFCVECFNWRPLTMISQF